jgi:autophagy-related protein 2
MILIAMDIRLEPERNSKTNKCAVALQSTLINHHITLPAHNCFKQLGDFLSLSEQVVEGYDPPSLITEMHLHLQDLQLEYCPLHLPLTALLSVSSVQLSTSLVVGSPLLVVRVLVDHTHLALSNTRHQPPSLSEDYVCVLDLDWFELTLRLCNTAQFEEESQKLFSHLPDISLECSSNVLQIHTCVDSCIALRDLLIYLASDGDLRPQPTAAREDSSSRAASLVRV